MMRHKPLELYQDQYGHIFVFTGKYLKTKGWEVFMLTSQGQIRIFSSKNKLNKSYTKLATDRNIVKKLTGFLLLDVAHKINTKTIWKNWNSLFLY